MASLSKAAISRSRSVAAFRPGFLGATTRLTSTVPDRNELRRRQLDTTKSESMVRFEKQMEQSKIRLDEQMARIKKQMEQDSIHFDTQLEQDSRRFNVKLGLVIAIPVAYKWYLVHKN